MTLWKTTRPWTYRLGLVTVAAVVGLATACAPEGSEQSSPDTTFPSVTVRAANPLYRQIIPTRLAAIPVELDVGGLPPLGADANYELWMVVDGQPMSGGRFDVAESGALIDDERSDGVADLRAHVDATAMMVTIEPSRADSAEPSMTHVLAGDVVDDGPTAMVADHPFAVGPLASGDAGELPPGWTFEGWVVLDGEPFSVGRSRGKTDLAVPDHLAGEELAVTIEPLVADDPEPFLGVESFVGSTSEMSIEATVMLDVKTDR